jgi:hypothetical protein
MTSLLSEIEAGHFLGATVERSSPLFSEQIPEGTRRLAGLTRIRIR